MKFPYPWLGALLILWVSSCTVMPRHIMDEALAPMAFPELVHHKDKYVDDTVVLGGYVLSVENLKNQSRMMVLQSPLGTGQQPGSKDASQGRMTLLYDGFLDAEVYTKNRKVTVGGRILAPAPGDPPPYPHLRIAVREIHLWPLETETHDPYDYDDRPYFPWGWHYPWYHRHRHHW